MDLKLHVMIIELASIFMIAILAHFIKCFDFSTFKAILLATAVFLIIITLSILALMYPILFSVITLSCVLIFSIFNL